MNCNICHTPLSSLERRENSKYEELITNIQLRLQDLNPLRGIVQTVEDDLAIKLQVNKYTS